MDGTLADGHQAALLGGPAVVGAHLLEEGLPGGGVDPARQLHPVDPLEDDLGQGGGVLRRIRDETGAVAGEKTEPPVDAG